MMVPSIVSGMATKSQMSATISCTETARHRDTRREARRRASFDHARVHRVVRRASCVCGCAGVRCVSRVVCRVRRVSCLASRVPRAEGRGLRAEGRRVARHGAEREGVQRGIVPRHKVDQEGDAADHAREQR